MVARNSGDLRTEINNLWRYVIIALTCMAPFGFIIQQGEGWHYFHIIALLWSYSEWSDTHGTAMAGFTIIDPLSIIFTSVLSSLRFLFVYYLMKHLKGVGSRRNVWFSAVLSQLPFSVYALGSILARSWTGLNIGGPMPLFVIAGLAIAHFKGREPSTTPWSEKNPIP